MMVSVNERIKKIAETAADAAVTMTRGNYFDNSERGELPELKEELNSDVSLVRREAVRKVIAGMTVGKDVSSLFPDILRCLQSKDLETKRLVYLYLVNYGASNPDLCLLAMNTFVRDSCEDKNPLIRSLSLRTMGSLLSVPNITDYIDEPLRRAAKDENSLVRRTAAICLGKLWMGAREYFEEMQLAEHLKQLLSDRDPFVTCNALAVYCNCPGMESLLPINSHLVARLSMLLDMNDRKGCGEWGIPHLMHVLVSFCRSATAEQAAIILQKCLPWMSHANPAASVACIRAMINYLVRFPDLIAQYDRRIAMCLATLISSQPPELQYVVLRLVEGLGQQHLPSLIPPLTSFLVDYSDPLYIRTTKLNILSVIANRDNIIDILKELAEYSKDVDLQFADAVVQCVAKLAYRVPDSHHIIIDLLLDFARTGLGHLFQSSVIAVRAVMSSTGIAEKGIFQSVLSLFLANRSEGILLDSPESRAAILWLASRAPIFRNDNMTVSVFHCFSFSNEALSVQYALLDYAFHLYSRIHASLGDDDLLEGVKGILVGCIKSATEGRESADLVERAILYDNLVKKGMLMPITEPVCPALPQNKLDGEWFLCEFGMLSTVYHEQQSPAIDTEQNRGERSVSSLEDSSEEDASYDGSPRDYMSEVYAV